MKYPQRAVPYLVSRLTRTHIKNLISSVLACLPLQLYAAPEISVNTAGYTGSNVEIPITIHHNDSLVAAQFDLRFNPALITIGQPSASALTNSGHELQSALIEPGRQRILIVPPLQNPVLPLNIDLSLPFSPIASAQGDTQLLLENIVFSTATDAHILPARITQGLLTLDDIVPPVLSLPPDILFEATAILSHIDIGLATAIDDRDGPVDTHHDAPTAFSLGATIVNWHASDSSGNTSRGEQLITLTDTTPPELHIPPAIQMEATAPFTAVTIGQATASDIFPIIISHNAPQKGFAVGEHTVTWRAIDENLNSSSAEQYITITDTTPPTIITPSNITTEANAVLSTVDIGTASASDLVDGPVNITHDAPVSYPLGATIVTYQAQDSRGNQAQTQQTIAVQDTTPPHIQAPAPITQEATAPLTPVALGTAIVEDIFPTTLSHNAPAAGFSVGNHSVRWTATDSSQNSSSATQSVTLTDTTPPRLTVPPDVVAEANAIMSTVALGSVSAVDLVDGEVAVSSNAPALYPLGQTIITYSTQDSRNNQSSAQQIVTVQDATPPVLTLPPDINVIASGPTTQIDIGTASAEDIFSVDISHNAPTVFPVGSTTVTWTAIDANGNQSQAQQTITASYQFGGWLSPLDSNKPHQVGRTIPVKFQLFYADGSVVRDAMPTIGLVNSGGDVVSISTIKSSGQKYLHNLETVNLEDGTYLIEIDLKDGGMLRVLEVTMK